MKRPVACALAFATTLSALPARAEPPLSDPFFGRDKAYHFGLSTALAAGGYGLASLGIEGRANRVAMGFTVAVGAGYAKEVFDAMGYGTPSWKDLVWDVIGSTVGVGIAVTIDSVWSAPPRRTFTPQR